MNIELSDGLTPGEAIETSTFKAMEILGISPDMYPVAKDWHDVKVKVGKLMQSKVKGRAVPYKRNPHKTPNFSTLKMLKTGILSGLYPKKIETSKEKYNYLADLLERKQIEPVIFNDLVSVLTGEYSGKTVDTIPDLEFVR